ncbi:MAG TPA: ATP-binding protein [Leptospiraceae bacterium]|nr:ATP-binding protein [Leptospiraceae bacterium]
MQLIKWILKEIYAYFKSVWVKILAQLAIFGIISGLYLLTTKFLPKRFRLQKYKFKQAIETVEEVSEFTPNALDTPIQIATKANGLFNRILDSMNNKIEDPHWDFKSLIEDKKPDFVVHVDDEFTSAYLPTVANFADSVKVLGTLNKNEYVVQYTFLVKGVEIPIIAISNQETLASGKQPSGGKSSISRGAFEDVFAYKKGDDFYSIINVLFDKVSNKLHLFADSSGNLQISPVAQGYDQHHYLVDEAFTSDLEGRIKKFKDKKMQRTIMLWGPPGTGKSLFVLTLANRTSGRVLKIDSSFIKQFNENKMLKQFCLKIGADLIVLDDVDHFVSGLDQNQTFLYILESLKTMEHKTTVMMTVNDIKKLNAAMLRPGRVDEIIQFKEPDELQRLDFIRRLLTEKLDVPNPNQEHIEKLAKAVKGMTQAYIKEWVEFYLVEEKDIEKVLAAISQRKKIMKSANISFDEDMD